MEIVLHPRSPTLAWIHSLAVSNLDEESKWTVHYTAPWHQQENVFLPGSRPPCVEDLHRQAKVNLKTALRECDKLRKDGFRSSQYYSQGPTFSDPMESASSLHDDEDDDNDKKSTASSVDDNKSQLSMRPQTPQGGGGEGKEHEADRQEVWTKATPLPTPEEKMRQVAQAVPTDVIPINVTGAVFDRQASIRRSLINTDTVSRRSKKVKRRKTISGLPDNFNQEIAATGRGRELRPHSMFIPGQYSTLGRVGSVNSTLRRSITRDSSCQTEEVKVVPPSMRRIRAQRGQGIAAQMAGISASSSTGSISISSNDISGMLVMPPQQNGDASHFHSLPRQGARVSLSGDPIYSSTPIKSEDQTTPQRQIGKLQVDDTVVHLRNVPRISTLPRPKSQEVRGRQAVEWGGGPACVVSPHAAYSTSLIPNATLSNSSEVIALPTSTLQHSYSPASSYPTARPLSLASSTSTDPLTSTAFTHSSTCPALAITTPTHTPLDDGLVIPAPPSESGCSDSSLQSRSTLTATPPSCQAEEKWIYDTPENAVVPHHSLTSSCSTPINQLYSSLDLSSRTTTDSSSLYSQDNDGYYTSMHLDSGLRSRSHGSGQGHGAAAGRATRHSMYECRELSSQEDSASLYSDRSLSRSISLRKSKKPPLPPARTDSLRRKPGAKKPLGGVNAISGANEANDATLNESLIASLQQSLQMGLREGKGKGASPSSPSHSFCSDYDDPWVLRSRSQSSVSATSSAASLAANAKCGGVSNVYSLCHVTPAQSDTSSLRSDYADSWGYYMDYPYTMSTGPRPGELQNGCEAHRSSKSQTPAAPGQEAEMATKPKQATSSPDRVHRLTSPSSGYSSQSNTPTAGTPVPSLVRSMSPSGSRPKPKVPERKSSLLSSVSMSSSSTSLSSITSDSLKSSGPPPPPLPSLPLSSSSAHPTVLPKPLITPFALQSVQLRSVKQPEKEINGKTEHTKSLETEIDVIEGLKPQALQKSQSQDHFIALPLLACSLEDDSRKSSPSPVSEVLKELSVDCSITDSMPVSAVLNEDAEDPSYLHLNGKENDEENEEEGEALKSPSQTSQSSPVKQKPPVVSKKPKFCSVPSFSSQPLQAQDSSQHEDAISTSHEEDQVDSLQKSVDEMEDKKSEEHEQDEDTTSRSSESTEESSEISTETKDESHIAAPASHEISLNHEQANGETHEEEDGTSSTTGSVSSKEEESGEVFDCNTADFPPATSANGACQEDMVTPSPTRPRTTDDLFAAIHRSKRKVLGRKESEEDKPRTGSHSPSPPVTPTAMSPGMRNLRKSTTSSDTFKALLLKKGSRSETSFRMSATEMLRSTDPRFQRTRSESALDPPASPSSPSAPHSPCASPGRGKRAAEEWNRQEGLILSSPTSPSFSLSGMKYGRSRTPPSAASSKYNTRSRLLSSPMTVICEREGEQAESEYGDATESLSGPIQSPLVLNDSNGTLSGESES
ncbi:hypothetical protein LDENG_00024120 [Lucifuga dentata]|nr:hypothetical protein LDENG_00024120 [Lucifuga dentata]